MKLTCATLACITVFITSIPTFVVGQLLYAPLSLTECESSLIYWGGGQSPYTISIIPANGGPPLEELPETTFTHVTWTANVEAGTTVVIQLRDGRDSIKTSRPITVKAGTDNSCIQSNIINRSI